MSALAVMLHATDASVLADGKELPPEVKEPLLQVLGWLLWLAFLSFTARLIYAGGRFAWARSRSLGDGEATVDVVVTLVWTVIASAASGIAAAILTF